MVEFNKRPKIINKVKIMGLFKWANNRVEKLSGVDCKLIGIASLCLGIILVKLFPAILNINIWWLVIIGGLSLLKVYYVILFKK